MYDPQHVFQKYNWLQNHHIPPTAGGYNDQDERDEHDLTMLSTILRRLQWERDQLKVDGRQDYTRDTRDFFDEMELDGKPAGLFR